MSYCNKKYILIFSLILLSLGFRVNAEELLLSKARVFYREDGGISIMQFVASSCQQGENQTQCMDRIAADDLYKNLPYDDIPSDQIPKDRKDRDKWRGEKGRGIWIDNSLVTKNEKIEELKEKLDKELDNESPDPNKVIKLQRLIEKAKDINHSILTQDDLATFEGRKKSFFASAINTVGDLFSDIANGIRSGFLALRNLIIGTPEEPSGVTIYDIKTKQPYCSVVVDGQTVNIPGKCSSEIISNYLNSNRVSTQQSSEVGLPNTIIIDTESPVLTIQGNNPARILVGSNYSDMGAVVEDNINDNLGYQVSVDGVEVSTGQVAQIDTSAPGEHTVTYTATDQSGNTGTATRTVIVYQEEVSQEEETAGE